MLFLLQSYLIASNFPQSISTKSFSHLQIQRTKRNPIVSKALIACENNVAKRRERSSKEHIGRQWMVRETTPKWIKQRIRINLKKSCAIEEKRENIALNERRRRTVQSAFTKMICIKSLTTSSHQSMINIIMTSLTNGFLKFLTRFSGKNERQSSCN